MDKVFPMREIPKAGAIRDWAKAFDALGRKADAEAKRSRADVIERENAQPLVAAK